MRKSKCNRSSGIGGQAVLEGVMMKNKDDYAVAIRKPNGEIEVEVDVFRGSAHGNKIAQLPFIRGVFNFIDSLRLGMKTLNYSASFYEDEDAKESKLDQTLDKISGGRGESILMGITTVISIILAVGIFILLPYFISSLLEEYIRNASLLAIVEGVIRILIFFAYVVGISMMKEVTFWAIPYPAEASISNLLTKAHNARNEALVNSSCRAIGAPSARNLFTSGEKQISSLPNRNGSFCFFMITSDNITLTVCASTVANAAPATFI